MAKPEAPKCIVLLNGPKYVGKDTIGNELVRKHKGNRFGFADPVKVATHYAFDTPNKAQDAYETCKDAPHKDFLGLSPRQAYIDHATFMRERYGDSVYARMAAEKIDRYNNWPDYIKPDLIVLSDCRFQIEFDYLANDRKWLDTIYVFKIHRDGYTFDGDVGGYLDIQAHNVWDINVVEGKPFIATKQINDILIKHNNFLFNRGNTHDGTQEDTK